MGIGDASVLTDKQKENVDIVIKEYGNKEAYWLREQTHGEAPWKETRSGLSSDAYSDRVITKDSMGIYYGGL